MASPCDDDQDSARMIGTLLLLQVTAISPVGSMDVVLGIGQRVA